ncbi:MAG: hypothetical protein RL266_379 [Bacteroidota bacterium]|jgi:uncharacterized delta-60 repeat protein
MYIINKLRSSLLILIIASVDGLAQPGVADPSFNSADNCLTQLGIDGPAGSQYVNSVVVQPDGKILVGGAFTLFNGVARNRIVRLNTDGTLDASFNPGTGFDNVVRDIALQPDGKIVVCGSFSSFNGTSRNRIARLNANGGLDATFNPGTGFNGYAQCVVVQSDGKLVVGGGYDQFNGVGRMRIARLNTNGSLDATFNPGTGFNLGVNAMVIQTDGKLIVSGTFSTFNGNPQGRIVRLNTNCSIDGTFATGTGFNDQIDALALRSDGKVIVGGWFTDYNGTPATRIAVLNSSGSIYSGFNAGSGFNDKVESIKIQQDEKMVIGGYFTSYNGVSRNRITRINPDGSLDPSFSVGTGFNSTVKSIDIQVDGDAVVGGYFTSYNGTCRQRIIRLLTVELPVWTGNTDIDWDDPTNWSLNAVPASTTDAIIPTTPIGGNMPTVNIPGAQVANITIENGATLTVSNGSALTLNGNLDNSGTLTIESGGSFLQGNSSSISNVGIFRVQRQGSTSYYNMWSSPITSQTGIPGTSYQYSSSASTQDDSDDQPSDPGWSSYNGAMTPGRGYAGQGGNLATFTGTPNNGNVNFGLYYAPFDNTFTQTVPGTPFNLIGNPYPSAISAASFISANTDIDGTIYLWNDNGSNNYSRTDYAYWNGTGGLGTGGGPTPNGYIGSCQGFMVRSLSGGAVANFTNNMRVVGNNAQFHRQNGEDSRMWFNVENADLKSEILIGLLEDATEDEDRMYDAVKLKGNPDIALSAVDAGTEYAILAFPPPISDRTIPLRLDISTAGEYSFVANTMENFDGYDVYLTDVQTNLMQQVLENTPITITLSADDHINRFYLNIVPVAIVTAINDGVMQDQCFQSVIRGDQLIISLSDAAEEPLIVEVLDLQGKVVSEKLQLNPGNRNSVPLAGMAKGIYLVRGVNQNMNITQRVVR